MLFYKFKRTRKDDPDRSLKQLGNHTARKFQDLMVQPFGEGTVKDALEAGQCAFVAGEWVIPETVTVVDGNAQATELDWSYVDSTTPTQSEHTITARRMGQIVKQSKNIVLVRGFEQVVPPAPSLITTTKGLMLTSDLISKAPEDGVQEFWLPTPEAPEAPAGPVVTETLADGSQRFLELVHRSAVARRA